MVLRNKAKQSLCHLYHDPPHIVCLTEHHLHLEELEKIHLDNYSSGANYCRKAILTGGASIYAPKRNIHHRKLR